MNSRKRRRSEAPLKHEIKDAPSDKFYEKSVNVLTNRNGVPMLIKRKCLLFDCAQIIGYVTFWFLYGVWCDATQVFKGNQNRNFPMISGNLYESGGFLEKYVKSQKAYEKKDEENAAIDKKKSKEKIASIRNLNYVEEFRVVCELWKEGIACKCYKQHRMIVIEEIEKFFFDIEFKESETMQLFGIGLYSSEGITSGSKKPIYDKMLLQVVICGHIYCVSLEFTCNIMLHFSESCEQNLIKALNEPEMKEILPNGIDDIVSLLRSHNKPKLCTKFFKDNGYQISPIHPDVINNTFQNVCRDPQYKQCAKTSDKQLSKVRQNIEKNGQEILNTIPQLIWPTLDDHINESTRVIDNQNNADTNNQNMNGDGDGDGDGDEEQKNVSQSTIGQYVQYMPNTRQSFPNNQEFTNNNLNNQCGIVEQQNVAPKSVPYMLRLLFQSQKYFLSTYQLNQCPPIEQANAGQNYGQASTTTNNSTGSQNMNQRSNQGYQDQQASQGYQNQSQKQTDDLEPGWEERHFPYYFNPSTGVSQWEKPIRKAMGNANLQGSSANFNLLTNMNANTNSNVNNNMNTQVFAQPSLYIQSPTDRVYQYNNTNDQKETQSQTPFYFGSLAVNLYIPPTYNTTSNITPNTTPNTNLKSDNDPTPYESGQINGGWTVFGEQKVDPHVYDQDESFADKDANNLINDFLEDFER